MIADVADTVDATATSEVAPESSPIDDLMSLFFGFFG